MPIPPINTIYLRRIETLIANGNRKILGLVGPPGSGKSTLAQTLRNAYPLHSQIVPMDGFHLANSELLRLGRMSRKGSPDTFDVDGYLSLLKRLRQQVLGVTIYAPEFRREIEEPIAGAIAVYDSTPLIITEGNYLLHQAGSWKQVFSELDEVWYVNTSDKNRYARLVQRHMQFGRNAVEANRWVQTTDDPNARLIAANRSKAHVQFTWDADE